jgi:hypothetical protein
MAWNTASPALSDTVDDGLSATRDNWTALQTTIGVTELTNGTKIIPSGTKMWFYADTAPTNWTLDATPSDELLAIKGGATYTTGGAVAGTWTIPSHTLTKQNLATHTHTVTFNARADVGNQLVDFVATNPSGPLGTVTTTSENGTADGLAADPVTHTATWRPDARVGILCSKD